MLHDDVCQSLFVIGSKKIDHTLMLPPDDLKERGIANAVRTDGVCLERHLFDHLNQRHIPADGEECMVEKQVFAKHRAQVALSSRSGMTILNFLQSIDYGTIHWQADQLSGTSFDERSYDIELLNLLNAVVADRGASVRLAHNDPHCLKIRKRLSDHMPLGGETRRELFLNDTLPRRQLTKRDFLFENANYIGGPRMRDT
jgi:hypothetical protein